MCNEKCFVNNWVWWVNYFINLSEIDILEENWNELLVWILREIE